MKLLNFKDLFINPSSFFWFPVLFSHLNPFSLSLFFPDFDLCFLFNINVFVFKKLLKKRGLQHNVFFFFVSPFFCKKKSILFWAPFFGQILVDVKKKKKQNKIGYFSTFLWEKKQNTILRCYYLGQVGVIIWAKFAAT